MDILSKPVLRADHRIAYGQGEVQFGDLWVPAGKGPHPVCVFFHGGWWKAQYDLGYAGYLCRALKDAGVATWSVEYRRVGNGGGWPGTFQDCAAGFDHVRELAGTYPLDLGRVFTMGHSAGGHLAFWTAGRAHLPPGSGLEAHAPAVALRGAVALAGAVDLRMVIELAEGVFAHDRDEVVALMGGTPEQVPERYAAGDPGALLPFQARQILLQGTEDDQIPPSLPARWVQKARRLGSHAEARRLDGADHFDVVDPGSKAWPTVLESIQSLLR